MSVAILAQAILAQGVPVRYIINIFLRHHGSTMLGEWWKCRLCQWCTPKGQFFCGGCGAAFKDLQAAPSHNDSVGNHALRGRPAAIAASGAVTPNGKDVRSIAKPAGRLGEGGRWRRQRASQSAAVAFGLDQADADTEDAEVSRVSALKEQMASLDAVVASLKGRTDEFAAQMTFNAKAQLRELRVQITMTKPLQVQLQTLEELVERRTLQHRQAEQDMKAAKDAWELAASDVEYARKQLSDVQKQIKDEEMADKVPDHGITGFQFKELGALSRLLPPAEAEQAAKALEMLKPLLVVAGMTPCRSHSPVAAGGRNGDNKNGEVHVSDDSYGGGDGGSNRDWSSASAHGSARRGRSVGKHGTARPCTGEVRRSRSIARTRLRMKSCMPVGFPLPPPMRPVAKSGASLFQIVGGPAAPY